MSVSWRSMNKNNCGITLTKDVSLNLDCKIILLFSSWQTDWNCHIWNVIVCDVGFEVNDTLMNGQSLIAQTFFGEGGSMIISAGVRVVAEFFDNKIMDRI